MKEILPSVNIWIFNNPIRGVTEQIDFLAGALKKAGCLRVSVSNRPKIHALNIVIENFSGLANATIRRFCQSTGKRVGVVLTEHVDFINNSIYFHGTHLDLYDDYMHPLTKRSRLLHQILLSDCVFCCFRLGDLPVLTGFDGMLPSMQVHTIPFFEIEVQNRSFVGQPDRIEYDFVFTGKITDYRKKVLTLAGNRHRLLKPEKTVSRRTRDAFNSLGKFVLNIPQNKNWRWISTMRLLAALRCGRPTLTIAENVEGIIAEFGETLPISAIEAGKTFDLLENHQVIFEEKMEDYSRFISSPRNGSFPHLVFDVWAGLEL